MAEPTPLPDPINEIPGYLALIGDLWVLATVAEHPRALRGLLAEIARNAEETARCARQALTDLAGGETP